MNDDKEVLVSPESSAAVATPPQLETAEEGWVRIEPPESVSGGRSFVSGEPDGDRLHVRYFRRTHDGALVGKVWFGPGAEGPPGHAHGGSMAAVLDEAMGAGAWMAGHQVLAAKLTTHFRRMLPLNSQVLLEAWVDRLEGRKVHTRGRLLAPGGEVFAEAEGLFIALEAERFGRFGERAAQALDQAVRRGSEDGKDRRGR